MVVESKNCNPGNAAYRALKARAAGTSVSDQSLLATDYLNQFTEVVMLLEMVPRSPSALNEARAWRPVGYQEHFRRSSLPDRDLAIEAWDHVPPRLRSAFETTVQQLDALIASTVSQLEQHAGITPPEQLRVRMQPVMTSLRRLIDVASGIIRGTERTLSPDEIHPFI